MKARAKVLNRDATQSAATSTGAEESAQRANNWPPRVEKTGGCRIATTTTRTRNRTVTSSSRRRRRKVSIIAYTREKTSVSGDCAGGQGRRAAGLGLKIEGADPSA
jgi:hypothetical protein